MRSKGFVINYNFLSTRTVRHSSLIETIHFGDTSYSKKTNYYITVVGTKGIKAALVFNTLDEAKALISLLVPIDQKACEIIDLITGEVIE